MNNCRVISGFLALIFSLTVLCTGCHTGPKVRKNRDWSLPTLTLPTAKKGDTIKPPAEKADPKKTAEVAQKRAGKDRNVILPPADSTLLPHKEEIAQLSEFKDNRDEINMPPLTPETGFTGSTETFADAHPTGVNSYQNTPSAANPTLYEPSTGLAGTTPSQFSPYPGTDTSFSKESAPSAGALPSSLELPEIPPAKTLAESCPLQSSPTTAQIGNQIPPQEALIGMPDLDPMAEIQARNSTQSTHILPVCAEQPTENHFTPSQASPAVLFAPGNISPNYPAAPY